MARSAKTRTDKGAGPEQADGDGVIPEAAIPDAEVIAETLPSGEAALPVEALPSSEAARPEDVPEAVKVTGRDERVVAGEVEAVTPEPVVEPAPEPEPEREPEPVRLAAPVAEASLRSEPPVPPPVAPVTVKRVGFVPLVLGGVVAAGIGFAAGWQGLLPQPGDSATEAALADQAARIDDVAARVAAIPAPDLAPVQTEIAALRADLVPLVDRIAALEERLAVMERAPANDGTLSATAIAAWQEDIAALQAAVGEQAAQTAAMTEAAAAREAELAALQAAMAAQEAEMARLVEAAAQRLDAAESTVAGIEEAATANANATLRRAVLASLQTAVDTGQPFAGLLSELSATGVEASEGLTAMATEGLATQAALREAFPDAARAALAAARAEGVVDDGSSGVMALLRSQLDVRSVEPREGDDPDAVLSRAEAALTEARLADALAEIATLPEVVRAPMTDWIAAAEARAAALSALQSLAETLPASDPAPDPATSN
jgi:hypothetical protein